MTNHISSSTLVTLAALFKGFSEAGLFIAQATPDIKSITELGTTGLLVAAIIYLVKREKEKLKEHKQEVDALVKCHKQEIDKREEKYQKNLDRLLSYLPQPQAMKDASTQVEKNVNSD